MTKSRDWESQGGRGGGTDTELTENIVLEINMTIKAPVSLKGWELWGIEGRLSAIATGPRG